MIRPLDTVDKELEDLRKNGIQRGLDTGFKCLDDLYSIRPGSFTIVHGAPRHGKSELIFEILINQAIKYNKKTLVYSPETGSTEEIYGELISKYRRKPFYSKVSTEKEDKGFFRDYHMAKHWVSEHFFVVDSEERAYSFNELSAMLTTYEMQEGITIDYLMAEPYNELDHSEMKDFGSRQDLYIEKFLSDVRRWTKKTKKHTFLSFHPGIQHLVKENNISYYPMPKAREAAGGQASLRKAFMWINIWRPHEGLLDENGQPYEKNTLLVHVEKFKPKGSGNIGITKLFFDWKQNRYFERINGLPFYAFEHESNKSYLQPSVLFDAENPPF